MTQILESVRLALSSIWANKLRSLLTLLGNIVAVSSIITVVSLIQGMNATVSDAVLSDLGADAFTIDRMGMIRNEDEAERARNNPRITIEEAEAIERFSPYIQSVMSQAQSGAASRVRHQRDRDRFEFRAWQATMLISQRSMPSVAA